MDNTSFLNAQEALFDNGVIRHVRFDQPMEILVDGKKHLGIVSMPGMKAISGI